MIFSELVLKLDKFSKNRTKLDDFTKNYSKIGSSFQILLQNLTNYFSKNQ